MITELWLRATLCLQQFLTKRLANKEGQGLVEYALILAFIALVVIAALKFLQPSISSTLNNAANNL
jgi:pilus assembly protein Flp/PilA